MAWLIFLVAAFPEVGGDATIRSGLRGSNIALIVAGFITLGCYGLAVNSVKWDFSKLMGVYVAFFSGRQRFGGPVRFQGECSAVNLGRPGFDPCRWHDHSVRPAIGSPLDCDGFDRDVPL